MKIISTKSWIIVAMLAAIVTISGCYKKDNVFNPTDQLKKEQSIIDQYIVDNNLTVQSDSAGAGIRYVLKSQGTGDVPTSADVVLVDYNALSIPNNESLISKDSAYVKLNGTISSWQMMLPYLKEGGEMLMLTPSYYAFGNYGTSDGSVPANTPLAFDIKLRETLSQFEFEQRYIEKSILDSGLVAKQDTVEGLWYIITKQGNGEKYPKSTDVVTINYKGMFLANGYPFDSKKNASLTLSNLIKGWQILMPYVSEGGSITMYIPSKFGYGTSGYKDQVGNQVIPGDATLLFEIDLISVD